MLQIVVGVYDRDIGKIIVQERLESPHARFHAWSQFFRIGSAGLDLGSAAHGDGAAAGPYLYSVVRNKCVDLLRRRVLHDRATHSIGFQGSFREEYDYTDYDARLELLKNRIESLPPKTKAIFILCHIDGYSYLEATRQLGISVNTAKTLLSRAMKTLREVCRPDEV